MAYKSIDELQTLLSSSVFGDRRDNKISFHLMAEHYRI